MTSQKPNIYLDIDGVILANDKKAANYADEFLKNLLNWFDLNPQSSPKHM